jgi:hypothetical protein
LSTGTIATHTLSSISIFLSLFIDAVLFILDIVDSFDHFLYFTINLSVEYSAFISSFSLFFLSTFLILFSILTILSLLSFSVLFCANNGEEKALNKIR